MTMMKKSCIFFVLSLVIITLLLFPSERMTVSILVHDRMSEKLALDLKEKLKREISQHYDFNFFVVVWKDKEALEQIEKKGNHYLKPKMYAKRYDYVVTVRGGENREFEFVAWSKNFFTNSIYLPNDLRIRYEELLEIAVNSFISIIEYTENKLYRNKCF